MIRITLNGARRKGHTGRVTCGITPSIRECPPWPRKRWPGD